MEHADAIQKAVDDYLLMERKARAWDAACRYATAERGQYHDRIGVILEQITDADPGLPPVQEPPRD